MDDQTDIQPDDGVSEDDMAMIAIARRKRTVAPLPRMNAVDRQQLRVQNDPLGTMENLGAPIPRPQTPPDAIGPLADTFASGPAGPVGQASQRRFAANQKEMADQRAKREISQEAAQGALGGLDLAGRGIVETGASVLEGVKQGIEAAGTTFSTMTQGEAQIKPEDLLGKSVDAGVTPLAEQAPTAVRAVGNFVGQAIASPLDPAQVAAGGVGGKVAETLIHVGKAGGPMAQRLFRSAISGATGGSIFSALDTATRQDWSDPITAAENVRDAMGVGAMIGGGLGSMHGLLPNDARSEKVTADSTRSDAVSQQVSSEAPPDTTSGVGVTPHQDSVASLTDRTDVSPEVVQPSVSPAAGDAAPSELATQKIGHEPVNETSGLIGGDDAAAKPVEVVPGVHAPESIPQEAPKELSGIPTSARKAMMESDRESLGLDALDNPERRGWAQALDDARTQGLHEPEKAMRLAAEVNATPRALSDTETAGLVQHAAKLKNDHRALMTEIDATNDPATLSTKAAEANRIEQEFDQLSTALRKSGTEKGRALAAQKLTLDENYDLMSVKSRAKAAKGEALTPEQSAKFEAMSKELADTHQKLADMETKMKEQAADSTLKVTKAKNRRPEADLRAEFDTLLNSAKDLLKKGCA